MRRNDVPSCPRHPDSTVWRDGTYGREDRKRQRYRCMPADGSPPHRFSSLLGTAEVATPRSFSYSAVEIAAALAAVGRGLSYRAAARAVPRSPAPDGNSVADWVELFAPPIYARHAARRWPQVVALDALPFHTRARDAGAEVPEGAAAFHILGALAYHDSRPGDVVALQAVPGSAHDGSGSRWQELLRSLEGAPRQIVCAPDPALLRALDHVWPRSSAGSPTVFLCHSHLRRQLLDLLWDERVSPDEALYRAADRAFEGARRWNAFTALPRRRRLRSLETWLNRYGERVLWQLRHARGRVTDTGELEERLSILRDQLAGRRGTLANRERTNRLLMLAQLELNGRADERNYAEIIKEETLARGGRAGPRRTIVDRDGSSLRP
jgi:hypothetical protein